MGQDSLAELLGNTDKVQFLYVTKDGYLRSAWEYVSEDRPPGRFLAMKGNFGIYIDEPEENKEQVT